MMRKHFLSQEASALKEAPTLFFLITLLPIIIKAPFYDLQIQITDRTTRQVTFWGIDKNANSKATKKPIFILICHLLKVAVKRKQKNVFPVLAIAYFEKDKIFHKEDKDD